MPPKKRILLPGNPHQACWLHLKIKDPWLLSGRQKILRREALHTGGASSSRRVRRQLDSVTGLGPCRRICSQNQHLPRSLTPVLRLELLKLGGLAWLGSSCPASALSRGLMIWSLPYVDTSVTGTQLMPQWVQVPGNAGLRSGTVWCVLQPHVN